MVPLPGAHLRSARVSRGLTLLDAAHETRIPVQRLDWLEQDNYAAFGSLTYARAFLKIYGAYLEVDVHELLEKLPSSRLHGPVGYRYLIENHGTWVSPDRRQPGGQTARNRKKAGRSPVAAGLVMFVLVLVGTGVWGYHVSQRGQVTQEKPPAKEVVTVPEAPQAEIVSTQVKLSRAEAREKVLQTRPVVNARPALATGMPDNLQ